MIKLSMILAVALATTAFFIQNSHALDEKDYSYTNEEAKSVDVWFFPSDEARQDGSEVTTADWIYIADFLKEKFISEYFQNERDEEANVNVWKYISAVDNFIESQPEDSQAVAIVDVLEQMLEE